MSGGGTLFLIVFLSQMVSGKVVYFLQFFLPSTYIDDLLSDLCKLGVGCHWDSLFAGAVCYADDLVLLAPSPSALRIMLNCCENFVTIRGLKFNPSKTQLICFSSFPSSSCSACFYFCGQQLPFLDTVSHLGHLLHHNLSDVQDINFKLHEMVRKANCLFATFPRVGPHILTCLFQSYCLSLYGSSLWSLSSPALQNIEVAFNKILHRIWSLPPRSHSRIVHLVALLCLFVPSFMIPLSTVSLSVDIITCLATIISSSITLKTSFALQLLEPYVIQLLTLILN